MASGDWKALLKAVQDGDLELARYYIYEGVDVNYEHPEMMTTLLIESVQAGREEMTALLLKHGANPRQRAGFGQKTALETAKAGKQENILRLLEAHAGPASSGLRFWQRWLAYLWH
ncbi:MAG: ankyrin repeat domain-containing protein [Lewinellaceae bacterium]|nr:ankyrin repeat domain-containing protein [Lewinellaceae bacterium]